MIKRSLDLLVAGFALAVTSPLFLVAAIGIRLTSPGPHPLSGEAHRP